MKRPTKLTNQIDQDKEREMIFRFIKVKTKKRGPTFFMSDLWQSFKEELTLSSTNYYKTEARRSDFPSHLLRPVPL